MRPRARGSMQAGRVRAGAPPHFFFVGTLLAEHAVRRCVALPLLCAWPCSGWDLGLCAAEPNVDLEF